MSHAYDFYLAVKQYSVLNREDNKKARMEKPPFAATGYQTYYAASDPDDALGKDCHIVLDRDKEMWNCTSVNGSSTCYEFSGVAAPVDEPGEYNSRLTMRFLPCPCHFCTEGNHAECTNLDIVGAVKPIVVTYVQPTVAPDDLQPPFSQYSAAILSAFIRRKNIKGKKATKRDMVRLITAYYSMQM